MMVAFSSQLPEVTWLSPRAKASLALCAFSPFGIFLLGCGARRDEEGGWGQLVSLSLLMLGVPLSWFQLPMANCMLLTTVMLIASATVVFAEEANELPAVLGRWASAPRVIMQFLGLAGQLGLIYLILA